ncbi:MBL fold metallo-hydrolase [cf. Phormidesmis sp. LEGE 11477]|nr:MBL fold metallo-hydrolase [cf. Phormidesmis sp. LEGE 11477]
MTNQRYGGNTICVEVTMGEQRLILDSGTGVVGLGDYIQETSQTEKSGIEAHLLFTHTHWDRIQGFPFFRPAFVPGNRFSVYGGIALNGASIKHCLTDQMLRPHFSVPLQNMLAELNFHTLQNRDNFQIGDISVETLLTNAATGALGYRLTWQDFVIVYATDTSIEQNEPDLLAFIDQADLFIHDGTYSDLSYLHHTETPEQLALHPWEKGITLIEKANIKKLALLHHSPIQNDVILDQLELDIRDRYPNAVVAYEGLVIEH